MHVERVAIEPPRSGCGSRRRTRRTLTGGSRIMKSNTQNLAHLCLVVLVLGAAFALASCGSSEQSASQENTQSSSSGSAIAAEAVHAVPAEATLPEPTASATGLPPDVMATLVDTSAAPGETVQ